MPELLAALGKLITSEQAMDERPISSIWYGHAEITPQTRPISAYDNNPIHETGYLQAIEWINQTANNQPYTPLDLPGGSDDRLRGMHQIPLKDFTWD